MKTALIFTILAAASISQALTVKGQTELNEWNTTPAGRAVLKPTVVHAEATITLTGDLKVAYTGYSKIEVCDEYGQSPNGEPEFAPCLKSHMTYAPKFEVDAPASISTTVEDFQNSQTTSFSADLTSCIENYESLIQLQEPSAAPPHVTLKSSCDLYASSKVIQISGLSATLADSRVTGTGQFMLEGPLKSSRVLTIDDGKVSADTAKEIAEAAKTLKSSPGFSSIEIIASLRGPAGRRVEVFTSPLRIDLQ